VHDPEGLDWSAWQKNSSRHVFSCYTDDTRVEGADVDFRVGTSRKLFATLTVYEISAPGDDTPGSFCIARGPVPLITLNRCNLLLANGLIVAAAWTALYWLGSHAKRARLPAAQRDEMAEQPAGSPQEILDRPGNLP
jgi:hypothetical protein